MPPGAVPLTIGLQPGEIEVILDPRAMNQMLKGTSGPVVRYLNTQGEKVKNEAKRLVGVSKPDPIRPGKPTGTLRNSIVKRNTSINGEPAVLVGVFSGPALRYAGFHHEGTQPHVIRAVRKPVLVFWAGGKVVRTKRVNHPGTRPNRFLVTALRNALR